MSFIFIYNDINILNLSIFSKGQTKDKFIKFGNYIISNDLLGDYISGYLYKINKKILNYFDYVFDYPNTTNRKLMEIIVNSCCGGSNTFNAYVYYKKN